MIGIKDDELKSALEQFGPLERIDIHRHKFCAFVEYQNAQHAKNAIATSNSQGGIEVVGSLKVLVETKRQVNRPRGGGPGQGVNGGGDGRGGYRGRGQGARGRGTKA